MWKSFDPRSLAVVTGYDDLSVSGTSASVSGLTSESSIGIVLSLLSLFY
jgi:hypothetical protein